jgi:hypothetical protein
MCLDLLRVYQYCSEDGEAIMRPIIFHADDVKGSENTETIVVSLSEMKTGLPHLWGMRISIRSFLNR